MKALSFLIFTLLCCLIQSIHGYEIVTSPKVLSSFSRRHDHLSSPIIHVRGGDESDDEEYAAAADDDSPSILSVSGVFGVLQRATIVTAKAMIRSIKAAFVSDDDDDQEEESSISTKIFKTLSRMWKAAIHPDDETSSSSKKKRRKSNKKRSSKETADFGKYLSQNYEIPDEREEDSTSSSLFLGGSFQDALIAARSQARLLVVFVPDNNKDQGKNKAAIRSLLSREVHLTANQPSRKGHDTGSFYFWGAKPGSTEAVQALKRAKVKQPPKGGSRPNLVVVYPSQIMSSHGTVKIVPKTLAQHHCSPPPATESMAAWLNALRKRHSKKEYKSMVKQLQELQYYQERQAGYKSSIQDDIKRKQEEKRQAQLEKEKAEKEKAHEEAMAQRRVELKESLPEEPSKGGEGIITIALRFADGRAGQRRFLPETPLSTIFDWVDAEYEMERETITLSTMNGQFQFEDWEDNQTLEEAKGIGRMTGLRVMKKEENDDDNADNK